MNKKLLKIVFSKRFSMVNFAITNDCNAKCVHCSFPTVKDKKTITLDEACKAIDSLKKLGVGVVSITGGEPFTVPFLPELVKHASEQGLVVYTGTNGSITSETLVNALKGANIYGVWVSVDSDSPDRFEKFRGMPGLVGKVKESVRLFNKYGIRAYAICVINKSINDFETLLKFLEWFGFGKVKFDYPMGSKMHSSYMGYSHSKCLEFSEQEISEIIGKIIALKKNRKGIRIVNPIEGLQGLVDYYKGKNPKYGCYAGKNIFYLDWNSNLYRCTHRGDCFGNVNEINPPQFGSIDCNGCYYEGCRDYDAAFFLLNQLSKNKLIDKRNISAVKTAIDFYGGGLL